MQEGDGVGDVDLAGVVDVGRIEAAGPRATLKQVDEDDEGVRCASSGGIVGEGYASAGGAGAMLPVDVHIPGCPPRPEAIIFGLLLAMGRLGQKIEAVRLLARGEPPASGA